MNLIYNSARHHVRTHALNRHLAKCPEAVYCPATEYRHHNVHTIVVTRNGYGLDCTVFAVRFLFELCHTTSDFTGSLQIRWAFSLY